MPSERIHRDGDVRFIMRCGHTDIIIANEWWVESIRERRSVGFLGFESWTREDDPIDFAANFSLVGQTIAPLNAATHRSTGYLAVKQGRFFFFASSLDPPIPEDQIVGVRADYIFNRENFTIEAGVNWPMRLIASIILVAVVIAAILLGAWLFGAL